LGEKKAKAGGSPATAVFKKKTKKKKAGGGKKNFLIFLPTRREWKRDRKERIEFFGTT